MTVSSLSARFGYRSVPMPFGSDRASDEWAAAETAWRESDRLSWLIGSPDGDDWVGHGLIFTRGISYLRGDTDRLKAVIRGWDAFVHGSDFRDDPYPRRQFCQAAGPIPTGRLFPYIESDHRFLWRVGWAFAQRVGANLEWDDWRIMAALACELPPQLWTWDQTQAERRPVAV